MTTRKQRQAQAHHIIDLLTAAEPMRPDPDDPKRYRDKIRNRIRGASYANGRGTPMAVREMFGRTFGRTNVERSGEVRLPRPDPTPFQSSPCALAAYSDSEQAAGGWEA